MTAMATRSAAETCRGCQERVIFVTEAFGSICTNCGTLMEEEEDYRLTFGESDSIRRGVGSRYGKQQLGSLRLQRSANQTNHAFHLEASRQHRPEVDAVARAILEHLKCSNLLQEVQDLVFQVLTIHEDQSKKTNAPEPEHEDLSSKNSPPQPNGTSVESNEQLQQSSTSSDETNKGSKMMLRGEQAVSRLAVAATFSILKKYDSMISLEDVCSIASIAKIDQIVDNLRYMESLLGNTALLGNSRDFPSAHIAGIITFLVKQTKLKPRSREVSPVLPQDDESVLEFEEQNFVREANVESPDFKQLALGLCDLCSLHGLNNRSSSTTTKKDLALCGWAILLLAMEASSGQVCNQGKMARAASKFYKANVDICGAEKGTQEQRSAAARTATEEVVKKRYVEISRMLTLYLEQLPWLSDLKPIAKAKRASKSKGRDKVAEVKQHLVSIKPFSRKVVARYLGDVIKLRRYIEFKLLKADREWVSISWSRFSSTEGQFHRMRQTVDGQRLIKDEELQWQLQQRSNAVAWSSQDGILAAINDLLKEEGDPDEERRQSSALATSIGSTLLQLTALEGMADEVVDSLLFEKGEMESYLRSSEEVQLLKTLRVDQGEWNRETTAISGPKRSRSEEEEEEQVEKLNVIGGKRTKALTEAEAARILSLL
jgi:hypothetical protein